jgi:hypothetical protein
LEAVPGRAAAFDWGALQAHVGGSQTVGCYSRPGRELLRRQGLAWLRAFGEGCRPWRRACSPGQAASARLQDGTVEWSASRRHDLRTRLGDLWNRLRVSDSGCDRSQYSLRDRSGRAVSFRIAADGKVGVGTFSPSHQFHVAKNQNANTLLARAGAAEDHRRSHRERRRADGAGARARTATLSAWTPRPLTPRRLPP